MTRKTKRNFLDRKDMTVNREGGGQFVEKYLRNWILFPFDWFVISLFDSLMYHVCFRLFSHHFVPHLSFPCFVLCLHCDRMIVICVGHRHLHRDSWIITTKLASLVSGVDKSPSSEFKPVISNPHVRVFQNGSLAVNNVQKSDAASYLCQVSNSIGSGLSKVVKLTVHGECESILILVVCVILDKTHAIESRSARKWKRIANRGCKHLQGSYDNHEYTS